METRKNGIIEGDGPVVLSLISDYMSLLKSVTTRLHPCQPVNGLTGSDGGPGGDH